MANLHSKDSIHEIEPLATGYSDLTHSIIIPFVFRSQVCAFL